MINGDSLSNKSGDLRAMLDTVEIKPGIMVVAEIKPRNSTYEMDHADYMLYSYNAYSLGIRDNKARGNMIYVNKIIAPTPFSPEPAFSEVNCLVVKAIKVGDILV